MQENLFDVLIYFFENYVNEEVMLPDELHQTVTAKMIRAGFTATKISEALRWFSILKSSLNELNHRDCKKLDAVRIFSLEESLKITRRARGYLMYLQQTGIIDTISRELIIDRAMALQEPVIGVFEMKWVTLVVLFNRPELKDQLGIMEELVFETAESVH